MRAMPTYTRKIYNGIMRVPGDLLPMLGPRVRILADYKTAVMFNPKANQELVAKSLHFLADAIMNEKRKKKG